MCGGYGDIDGDGKSDGIGAFFTDITDGGGAGRSGARFSSGDTSVLDDNNDRYVSEAEYMRGQKAYEANEAKGGYGRFGDAYNDAQTGISTFSNSFGALPRGSIASEAALGSDGRDISTSRIARFMQGGGVLGAIGRGLTGGNIMSPEYVSPDQGDMTRDEYDRAIVKSFNSMGNTGEQSVPPEVAAAMGRVRGLNPRAVSVPAPVAVNNVEASTAASTADASGTSYVVNAEDMGGGMVKVFYGDNSSEIMPAINYQLMMRNYV
tara:strand:+ start:60 stop:851 length:792 start_codon:yes stop_codon:yes gene_type:complete